MDWSNSFSRGRRTVKAGGGAGKDEGVIALVCQEGYVAHEKRGQPRKRVSDRIKVRISKQAAELLRQVNALPTFDRICVVVGEDEHRHAYGFIPVPPGKHKIDDLKSFKVRRQLAAPAHFVMTAYAGWPLFDEITMSSVVIEDTEYGKALIAYVPKSEVTKLSEGPDVTPVAPAGAVITPIPGSVPDVFKAPRRQAKPSNRKTGRPYVPSSLEGLLKAAPPPAVDKPQPCPSSRIDVASFDEADVMLTELAKSRINVTDVELSVASKKAGLDLVLSVAPQVPVAADALLQLIKQAREVAGTDSLSLVFTPVAA